MNNEVVSPQATDFPEENKIETSDELGADETARRRGDRGKRTPRPNRLREQPGSRRRPSCRPSCRARLTA